MQTEIMYEIVERGEKKFTNFYVEIGSKRIYLNVANTKTRSSDFIVLKTFATYKGKRVVDVKENVEGE